MEAIVVEFEVSTSPGHAFDVWTSRPSMWWPRSHTITQDSRVSIVFEPYEGGRIFERGTDGAEHDWGEILIWEPPARVGYRWHLFFDRNEATEVTVTFAPVESGTLVTLTQTGFESLGDPGIERQRRTNQAWLELTGLYRGAI